MRNAAVFVRQQTASNQSATTQQVLAHGYNQALLDDEVEAGSTTACIVRLKQSPEGKPVLEYSNLGDSGFVVIRNGEIIFRSRFQYYGRAPYQLAKIPLRFKQYGAIENHPDDADSGEIDVQDGDLVVLATDGVWDNFAPDLQKAPSQFPVGPLHVLVWFRKIAGVNERCFVFYFFGAACAFVATVLVGRACVLRGCDRGEPRQGRREHRAGLAPPQPQAGRHHGRRGEGSRGGVQALERKLMSASSHR
ncbi:hypothetical protein ON010_g18912 [Phytophthora cinnamomi]|nr:hypothetical protein ON010_g18912 [Phytophthora cinnamomi]